jgi:hypothetical protein
MHNKALFSKPLSSLIVIFLYSTPALSLDVIGISAHFNRYTESSDVYLSTIKNYGFNGFRAELVWNQVEREKGQFSIGKAIEKTGRQAFEYGLSRYGLSAMVVLGPGNTFYSHNAIDYPRTPEAIQAFSHYAAWVAARYKGRIKYYDIWNEWLYGTGLTSQPLNVPPPEVYFELVKATSQAIRKVDPEAVIMAGSFNTNIPRDVKWFDELMKMGILDYIDGVSIHPYSLRLPEDNIAAIDQFEVLSQGYAKREVPIYITEVGNSGYSGMGYVTDEAAAQYVVKYSFLAKTRPYIKGLWWYVLKDKGSDVNNREDFFGFFTQSNKPKESALVFKKISNIITDYKVVKYQETPDGKVSIVLRNYDKNALVYWQQEAVEPSSYPKSRTSLGLLKGLVKSNPDIKEGPIRLIDQSFGNRPLYIETNNSSKSRGGIPTLIISDKK